MDTDQVFSQKIANYKPSAQAFERVRAVPILIAVGISGAGKDTVLQRLFTAYPDDYTFMVSHTTRKQRENDGVMEQNGVEYYFIDHQAANRMLDEEAFVEANYYASNLYGSSVKEIERAGQAHKILISDIDVNGVGNYMRLGMNAKPVFLLPPSYQVWRERLQRRYGATIVDKQDLHKRMQIALLELQKAIDNDYFYLIINDDLDKTVQLVNDIAHGAAVEPRYPKALECAKQIAADITAELRAAGASTATPE